MKSVLLGLVITFVFTLSVNSTTIYVDTTGNDTTGNGSVLNPYATIQTGIDASVNGDSVLVNDGEYLNKNRLSPASPRRVISFNGKNIVVKSINGPEFTTIIADDYGHAVEFVNAEDSTAVLEGFFISGRDVGETDGSGVLIDNASPLIYNCRFTGAKYGNSTVVNFSKPNFINCTFVNNNGYSTIPSIKRQSISKSLGTVEVTVLDIGGTSEVLLDSCLIDSSYAEVAIRCVNSSLIIRNTIFSYNNVGFQNSQLGSALHLNNSTAIINNTLFIDGWNKGEGGAIGIENNSLLLLDSSEFINNYADLNGGAIYCTNSEVQTNNTLFTGNSCSEGSFGSVIFNNGSSININYTTIVKNINNSLAPFLEIPGCLYGADSMTTIINSIISDNKDNQAIIITDSLSIPNISCSDIYGNDYGNWEGTLAALLDSNNNISLDPRFCDTSMNDFSLAMNSPCASFNNTCSTIIGAFDVGCDTIIHVWHIDTAGSDSTGDGSILNPFNTIQRGIDASINGDTVLVNDGEYLNKDHTESTIALDSILFNGKSIIVKSVNGKDFTTIVAFAFLNSVHFTNGEDSGAALEGFSIIGDQFTNNAAGGGLLIDNASPIIRGCSFSGGKWGNLRIINNAEPYFNGCTFQKNEAFSPLPPINNLFSSQSMSGSTSAIDIKNNSNVTLDSCVLDSNLTATAIQCYNSTITIQNCSITNTHVGFQNSDYGTALHLDNSVADIINSFISGNTTVGWGGAIAIENNSTLRIDSSDISNNYSSNSGGAIFCNNSTVEISNSLLSNNSCSETDNGSAIFNIGSSLKIDNSSFIKNENKGFYNQLRTCIYGVDSMTTITNLIISYNVGGQAIVALDSLSLPTITCTNIYGNEYGNWIGNIASLENVSGNFSLDPLFCDTSNNIFTLDSQSPCLANNNSCNQLIGSLGFGCSCCIGIRGNVNNDEFSSIDISDLVFLVAFMFQSGSEPICLDEANIDGIGEIDISDLVVFVAFMFQGGVPPADCP